MSTVYDAYRRSGQEERRWGIFPKVVWLVASEARYGQMVELLSRQPVDSWELHQVGRQAEAVAVLTGGQP